MARFAQYAMVATEEALNDAGWLPEKEEDLETTVRSCHPVAATQNSFSIRAYTWARALEALMMCMRRLWRSKKEYVGSFCVRLAI